MDDSKEEQEEDFVFLFSCANIEETRYFTDDFYKEGIIFTIEKQELPVMAHPTLVARLNVFIKLIDFERANELYGTLTAFDEFDKKEVEIRPDEWEDFTSSNDKIRKKKERENKLVFWIIFISFIVGIIFVIVFNKDS